MKKSNNEFVDKMVKQQLLIKIFFCFLSVQSNTIIGSSRSKDVQKLIIYEPTESLLENLNSLQLNFNKAEAVKQELLEQAELDVFSRESIEEIFASKIYKIRSLLCERLCDRQGKLFHFDKTYLRKKVESNRAIAQAKEIGLPEIEIKESSLPIAAPSEKVDLPKVQESKVNSRSIFPTIFCCKKSK